MPIFRGELKGNHPDFPKGSKAAVLESADGPTAKGDERIEYTAEDDKALEQKIRETLSTTWHSLVGDVERRICMPELICYRAPARWLRSQKKASWIHH